MSMRILIVDDTEERPQGRDEPNPEEPGAERPRTSGIFAALSLPEIVKSRMARAIGRTSGPTRGVETVRAVSDYEAEVVTRLLTDKLPTLIAAAREQNAEERVTQLIRAIAPPDPLAEVELKIAEATVALRREFLEEVPVMTSAEVHAQAGFPGGNPSQTVHRWRKAGKIFAINHGGRDLYPAFQFGADGRPLPIVAELLAILARDPERTDWDNALWFAGESGWLDGRAPKDCLTSDPDGVKRAAEQEVLVDEH